MASLRADLLDQAKPFCMAVLTANFTVSEKESDEVNNVAYMHAYVNSYLIVFVLYY